MRGTLHRCSQALGALLAAQLIVGCSADDPTARSTIRARSSRTRQHTGPWSRKRAHRATCSRRSPTRAGTAHSARPSNWAHFRWCSTGSTQKRRRPARASPRRARSIGLSSVPAAGSNAIYQPAALETRLYSRQP